MLDKAAVLGEDVGGASFGSDPTHGWVVSLEFKGDGQNKWTKLTSDVYGDGTAPEEQRRVAIVLDNKVVSAPTIQQGSFERDQIQISGSFSESEAKDLALVLRYGQTTTHIEELTRDHLDHTAKPADFRPVRTRRSCGKRDVTSLPPAMCAVSLDRDSAADHDRLNAEEIYA